ncbi:MAG: L,D-transpeptidase [Halanaerobiaceae bacterium]
MNKKYFYIFMFLLVIAVAGSAYFMNISPDGIREEGRKDRLSKTELSGVEENINAYDIEDDFKITQNLQREEKDLLTLRPREITQMLQVIGPKRKNTVLHQYDSRLPETINNQLQYLYYNISYDYFLVMAENGADVNENPDPATAAVARVENMDKVSLLQRVDGENIAGSNIWYRVAVEKENQISEGYLHSSTGTPRKFRFGKMEESINNLKQEIAAGNLHYVINYKNQNGAPPQEGDTAVDEHGYRVYHSAPAYVEPRVDSNYRYVPDGMLVRILGEKNNFYYVNILTFDENYYIPQKYINTDTGLNQLKHVLVVDRDQQNQAVFELAEDGLDLISYTLATTGKLGNFSFETSLGSYKALEKKERFEYLKKGSEDIAGYAPFATRFSGGAYVHGVPVSYKEQNGEKIDPGREEYIQTIGTFPRSSMCVRNFTSHAEFIYNWMDVQNGAVIVIE